MSECVYKWVVLCPYSLCSVGKTCLWVLLFVAFCFWLFSISFFYCESLSMNVNIYKKKKKKKKEGIYHIVGWKMVYKPILERVLGTRDIKRG